MQDMAVGGTPPTTITYPSTTGARTASICPGCNGNKIQIDKDGIRILCPVCGGKGYWYGVDWYELPYYTSITVGLSSTELGIKHKSINE